MPWRIGVVLAVLLATIGILPLGTAAAHAQAKGADGPTRYQACYFAERRAYKAASNNKACYRRCGDCKKNGRTWNCRAAYKDNRESCGSGFLSADPDRHPFPSQQQWLDRYYPEVTYSAAFGGGSRSSSTVRTVLPWVPANLTVVKTTATNLRFVIDNPSAGRSNTRVLVDVYDTMYRKWMPAFVDITHALEPSQNWVFDQPTSDKACYRFRSENMTATGWTIGWTRIYPATCAYGSPSW